MDSAWRPPIAEAVFIAASTGQKPLVQRGLGWWVERPWGGSGPKKEQREHHMISYVEKNYKKYKNALLENL
jgi:hypothetical protein